MKPAMTYRGHHIWRIMVAIPLVAALFVAQHGANADIAANTSIGDRMTATAANAPMAPLAIPMDDIAAIPPFFGAVETGRDDGMEAAIGAAGPEPRLIGIAGRLPDDAEVLLRMPDGGTTSLRIGESANGWRLVSIAADRAVFADRERRIVLTMGPMP